MASESELRSLQAQGYIMKHLNSSAKYELYDQDVLPSYAFDSNVFFHRARSLSVLPDPLEIYLPSVGTSTSFHIMTYTGVVGAQLELIPQATDSINLLGDGVPALYDGNDSTFILVLYSFNEVWHIGVAGLGVPEDVEVTAGTGITVTGTPPEFIVTNSAPDQVVAITSGGGCTIGGVYPNFTVSVP
jgi:hypothetical protein